MKPAYPDSHKETNEKTTQWQRDKIAATIIDFQSAKVEQSQRQFAKKAEIPRTTLQHWLSRKETLCLFESPELVEFLESPTGIKFLHIIVLAAQYEFRQKGPASIHNVSNFLKRCGLSAFIGASYSSQRLIANDMDQEIIKFGESEQKQLVLTMPEKWITLCEDETFHPAICLVAMEAQSNFILLEEYADKRDAQTWNKVVGNALEDMPVKVVQVTSDEAKGLINHTTVGLGAHHSPDVFHVQQEIVKGTSGALAGIVKTSEKQVEAVTSQVQKKIQLKEAYDNNPKRPPGRRPHFENRIAEACAHKVEAEKALDHARKNQEAVKQAIREIGACYHPYNPETGEKQDAQKISNLLASEFDTIYHAADGLSERCIKHVKKAHRVVKHMIANIAFFFVMVGQYLDNMGLSEYERKIMHDYLIPGFYLQVTARKEKDEIRKETISNQSKVLLSILSDPNGPLSELSTERIEALERAAKDCAGIFQRSSSCVEGRNAQLSLRHHGIHRLSTQHLKALTIVHNFDTRNRDGTTPAERFFEAKHNDLFESLFKKMAPPVRPRNRLSKAA